MKRLLVRIAPLLGLTAALAPAVQAQALPISADDPPAVAGIPAPCVAQHQWPGDSASASAIKTALAKNFKVRLVGEGWTDPRYQRLVKFVWQSLDAVSCTPFLAKVQANAHGGLTLNAAPTRTSWAWGDYGLTRPDAVTLNFSNWITAVNDDPGRIVRVFIHELGHVWSSDDNTAYRQFTSLFAANGQISSYGGSNVNESFSEMVGYYVARCALNNPYDKGTDAMANYYAFARKQVFNDVEFGPRSGAKVDCSTAAPDRVPPPPPRTLLWAAPSELLSDSSVKPSR